LSARQQAKEARRKAEEDLRKLAEKTLREFAEKNPLSTGTGVSDDPVLLEAARIVKAGWFGGMYFMLHSASLGSDDEGEFVKYYASDSTPRCAR